MMLLSSTLVALFLFRWVHGSRASDNNFDQQQIALQNSTSLFHKNFKVFWSSRNATDYVTPVDISKLNNIYSETDGLNILRKGTEQKGRNIDYVEIPKTAKMRLQYDSRAINKNNKIATVELLIVVDNILTLHFNSNMSRILEYFAITVKSVNSRFESMQNPSVRVVIVGIVLMKNKIDQPFIENNKKNVPGNYYDGQKILPDFGRYLTRNVNTMPPHDLGALFTGVDLGEIEGVAYRGGVCRKDIYKVSVNVDIGAVFRAVHVLAHEIGHSLGSSHDGEVSDAGTEKCPSLDHFVMTTSGGYSPNSGYFSSCSKLAMERFLRTIDANCLYTSSSTATWATPSLLLPGDKITMLDFCKAYRPDSTVPIWFSGDELCANVACTWVEPCAAPNQHNCGFYTKLDRIAPDGVSCGVGKKCMKGKCQ